MPRKRQAVESKDLLGKLSTAQQKYKSAAGLELGRENPVQASRAPSLASIEADRSRLLRPGFDVYIPTTPVFEVMPWGKQYLLFVFVNDLLDEINYLRLAQARDRNGNAGSSSVTTQPKKRVGRAPKHLEPVPKRGEV